MGLKRMGGRRSASAGMRRLHQILVPFLAFLAIAELSPGAAAASQRGQTCIIDAKKQLSGVLVNDTCVDLRQSGHESDDAPVVKVRAIACHRDGSSSDPAAPCGPNPPMCKLLVEGGPADQDQVAWAYQQFDPATGRWATTSFWCPMAQASTPSGPDAATLRDQALRLLPSVSIATTDGAYTLVNLQTLLWANTLVDRNLGTVTVLGQLVHLRAHFRQATWTFGDGESATTSTPGKAYDRENERCNTALCPHYYGHVYRETGAMTITLRIAWDASYSTDGTAYRPVPGGAITGPAASTAITVREARGVLVADPADPNGP